MRLNDNSLTFRAASGKQVIFIDGQRPYGDGDILVTETDGALHAIVPKGMSSCGDEWSIGIESPHTGIAGRIERNGDKLSFHGEWYHLVPNPTTDLTVVPLPDTRRVEYLLQDDDGQFVFVGSDQYNYSYGSFRLYVGDGQTMRELPVTDVERYKDGGTTFVYTPNGTLFVPVAFREDKIPNWQSRPLKRLTPDEFVIIETITESSGSVTISPRG